MKHNFRHLSSLVLFFISYLASAQDFTSFFTGNTSDASTNPQFGICLIGGATEPDSAMQWFLNLADGGDVLVIRTSGSDGYNDYLFNQLGVSVNSVETIRIENANGALDPYVLQKLSQAEAIWFAGGDQADYVSYFKNNDFETILNNHINVKNYPIGGISAGMAIMGDYYFDALNGTVTSQECLSNPFDSAISLGISDFIDIPFLAQTITDTHYDNPDRKGRHSTFLARLQDVTNDRVFGIGIDEFTSVCINANGIAQIFGEYPAFDDFAYFVQINCLTNTTPENLSPNQALDWDLNQESIKVYRVPGNIQGTTTFDLNTWDSGSGGQWENWWIDQGVLMSQNSTPIDCDNLSANSPVISQFNFYPNPTQDLLNIESSEAILSVQVFTLQGKEVLKVKDLGTQVELNVNSLANGVYFAKIYTAKGHTSNFKFIKE